MPKFAIGIFSIIIFTAVAGTSAVINVPLDQPTIQDGIDAANPGDTVMVGPRIYSGDLNRDLEFGGKAIVVKSEMGPEMTTINPEGDISEPHRAFRFVAGEDGNSIVDGFTITGGFGPFERDRFIGGGIYCENSSPTIKSCIFDGNEGPVDGGAISGFGAGPTIIGCTFKNNNAIHGGAIFFNGTSDVPVAATLNNCHFEANSARIADGYGGALYFQYGNISVNMENCVFYNNQAFYGGAIVCGDLSFSNLMNITVVGNTGTEGGGIAFFTADANIENSICAFNNGTGVHSFIGDIANIACCDIFGNSDGNYFGFSTDYSAINNNFSLPPGFCDPNSGNFAIFEHSPCAPENNNCGVLIGARGTGCMCGNTNGDDRVNLVDAVYLIKFIFMGGPAPDAYNAGDVNCSDEINISDVVNLINYIFISGSPPPCDPNNDGIFYC